MTDWNARARQLSLPNYLFVDGEKQSAEGGRSLANLNPATGETLAQSQHGSASDVDRAVGSARRAFSESGFRKRSPRERGQCLVRLADLIKKNGDELALLETLDIGKPIRYTTRVDLLQAELTFRWYGEAIDKTYDHLAPTAHDIVGMVSREPLGVVGAITPWNFPMMIGAWKIAPALALGNSVVWKPAEQSPSTALRIAELAIEAGLPKGVLNVVTGDGPETGRALAEHMDVDAIAFTGSTETGRKVLGYSASSNMKRVSLETGGNTPNVIFEDAPDLPFALRAAGFSVFWNSGAMCVAGARLLVQRPILDQVLESLVSVAKDWQPGDPLDPKTKAGAIVDEAQFTKILSLMESGTREGASILTGGSAACIESGGYFIEPTVFFGVNNQMTIAQEEIFGPVMTVIPFDSEEEALEISNDTRFGLSAAVWTANLSRAHRMARDLQAGTVWVNNFDQADLTAPFGGFKESGFGGKDKSIFALEKYSNQKTTWINFGKGGR